MSVLIFVTVLLGIGAGMRMPEAWSILLEQGSSWMLLLLLFCVGIEMGANRGVFRQIYELGLRVLLIPLGVVLGSLAGGLLTAMVLGMGAREGMAITAGLGWYSLSGILLTEAGNPIGGSISFLSNVFREMLTFILVPWIAKHINGYCAIAPAGATSMDTTLGVISKHTDGKIAILAFVNGVICTLLVPILMPFFL